MKWSRQNRQRLPSHMPRLSHMTGYSDGIGPPGDAHEGDEGHKKGDSPISAIVL